MPPPPPPPPPAAAVPLGDMGERTLPVGTGLVDMVSSTNEWINVTV